MSKRADDQAISNVGPLTAFCGVAVVAAGVLVGSTIQPAASSPRSEAAPQVSQVAISPVSEPDRISLSPEQVDQMRIASNLVSGVAAPVKVVELPKVPALATHTPTGSSSGASATATPVSTRSTRSVTRKSTRKKSAIRTKVVRTAAVAVRTTSKAPVPTSPATPAKIERARKWASKHAAKAKRTQDRIERRAEQREQWMHKWATQHGERQGFKRSQTHNQRHGQMNGHKRGHKRGHRHHR